MDVNTYTTIVDFYAAFSNYVVTLYEVIIFLLILQSITFMLAVFAFIMVTILIIKDFNIISTIKSIFTKKVNKN